MDKQIWDTLHKAMECLENTEAPDDIDVAQRREEAIIKTNEWLAQCWPA